MIVVSEETGAISLAERGNLLRKLTPDGLRAMLQRSLMQNETDRGSTQAPAAEPHAPEARRITDQDAQSPAAEKTAA